MSLITLEKISVYSDNYKILDEVSFDFPKHLSTVIMGPSGCGKSTFLKTAAGLINDYEGRLTIQGTDFFSMNRTQQSAFRKSSGFVFQDAALWANKSVFQNIELPLKLHFPSMSASEISKRITDYCAMFRYQDQLTLRPDQISTGEKKIVAFIRAVVTDPDIIFMDEPTGFLDQDRIQHLLTILQKFRKQSKTFITVTNNFEFASILADYLVIMEEGKIADHGPFNEMIQKTETDSFLKRCKALKGDVSDASTENA